MRSPKTVRAAEEFGRARLSRSFFMRDFLYREISNVHGIPNLPGDPGLAIAAGSRLCQDLLQATFGRLTVRSAYRTRAMNALGNARHYNCASNARNTRATSGTAAIREAAWVPWLALSFHGS